MAKYKIGITEAGEAGLDLSWVKKLDTVDGAVVITKCISPEFYDAVLANKDKLILHATFTGYGHSVLEPNVPPPYDEFDAIMALEKAPQSKLAAVSESSARIYGRLWLPLSSLSATISLVSVAQWIHCAESSAVRWEKFMDRRSTHSRQQLS